MSIVGLDQVGSNAAQTSESKTSVMGKDDFLQLLVTQLQRTAPSLLPNWQHFHHWRSCRTSTRLLKLFRRPSLF